MAESQNIEYKQSWHDDYLKCICGFANARGGRIYIGKDDNGRVIGIKNAKKLLEDIPNKVRDILGIIIDVNLLIQNGKDFIEIKVDAYPSPVNYKGQYYFRSSSTKQELKGATLDRFLLSKQGINWDGVPLLNVGYFRTDTDLLYQDEIHGNLFSQAAKTLALLQTKYLKAYISTDFLPVFQDIKVPAVILIRRSNVIDGLVIPVIVVIIDPFPDPLGQLCGAVVVIQQAFLLLIFSSRSISLILYVLFYRVSADPQLFRYLPLRKPFPL